MTIILYAQPYNMDATGFQFISEQEFKTKRDQCHDKFGNAVEEFEIQLLEAEEIDCEFAKAIGLSQANYADFLELADAWEHWQKVYVIISVGALANDFDPYCDPHLLDISVYAVDSLRELAEQFVDEGLFGTIPERLEFYIDYEAIARDLGFDYSEITIAGERMVYSAL